MASYALEEPCEFIYRIKAVTKVVDGDTVDCVFDLGFDVMFHSRVRLLGIDTPESRTRHKNEKIYGKLSKKKLKEWVHWAVESDRDDIDIELRCPEEDSRGKFGRILGDFLTQDGTRCTDILIEEGHAVEYHGGSKEAVDAQHMANRTKLLENGVMPQAVYDAAVEEMK